MMTFTGKVWWFTSRFRVTYFPTVSIMWLITTPCSPSSWRTYLGALPVVLLDVMETHKLNTSKNPFRKPSVYCLTFWMYIPGKLSCTHILCIWLYIYTHTHPSLLFLGMNPIHLIEPMSHSHGCASIIIKGPYAYLEEPHPICCPNE